MLQKHTATKVAPLKVIPTLLCPECKKIWTLAGQTEKTLSEYKCPNCGCLITPMITCARLSKED
mgnify:CR=1 FL=1